MIYLEQGMLAISSVPYGHYDFEERVFVMKKTTKTFPRAASPFFLDMSTQFNQLAKIIHMYMLTISRFFCIVLLKGGNVYVT